jgi:Arc/MetJ-type ribon-helix-helix transcriptional regulator
MKRRLSASIDEDLLAAVERAVAEGRAPSVSALVEEALALRVEEDRREVARQELLQWMHDEWGPLADEERVAADASIEANTIRFRNGKRVTDDRTAA